MKQAQDVRSLTQSPPPGPKDNNKLSRPRVYVVNGKAFIYDAASAASLLSDHRIWATPIGARRAGNKSPEHNFPCVLTQKQMTLVLRHSLADVYVGHPSDAVKESQCAGAKNAAEFTPDGGAGVTVEATYNADGSLSSASESVSTVPRNGQLEWGYPRTTAEKKSMAVFEDLWAKGLCVAGGSNYGADYVVYDGPPTECHSAAAVLISRGPNDELAPTEVSGFARVQQAAAKAAVIATAPTAAAKGSVKEASIAVSVSANVTSASSAKASEPSLGDEVVEAEGVRYFTLRFHSVSSRA